MRSAQRAEGGGAEPRRNVARRGFQPDIHRPPAAQAQRRPVRGGRFGRGHPGAEMSHYWRRRQRCQRARDDRLRTRLVRQVRDVMNYQSINQSINRSINQFICQRC